MADEWTLMVLDDKIARRNGVPPKIPVPKAEMAGMADDGMSAAKVRDWVTRFMTTHGDGVRRTDADLARRLDAYVGKQDAWKKAQEAIQKSDLPKAISSLKMVIAVDKDDHVARLNLASALAASGDPKAAAGHLDAIRPTFEGDAEYHVIVGQIRLSQQDKDGAIGEMVLALEAQPDHVGALDVLKQLGVLAAIYEDPLDPKSLTYVRTDSILAWVEGLWTEPKPAAEWLRLIAYHSMEGRPAVTAVAAERALAQCTDDERPAFELAAIRSTREKGDTTAALARADAALAAKASSSLHVERARCLEALGRNDEARAALEAALALDPGDLEALDLAYLPRDRTDLATVGQSLPKLVEHAAAHPKSAGAYRTLARAELLVGATDQALDHFAQAVALAPTDDDLVSEQWTELLRAQQSQAVIDAAAKIEDIARRSWKLRWNEAEAMSTLGRTNEAYAAFAALAADESLMVDVRRRAKRAAEAVRGGGKGL
jgi:tetratricopeptide (TPR) repeat protein